MKLIIASILIFSLVIIFLFALFPSEISVSRIVQINRPKEEIRKKITNLREWKSWNQFIINTSQAGKPDSVSNLLLDSNFIHIGDVQVNLLKTNSDTVITVWRRGKDSFAGDFILKEMDSRTILEWTLYFHIKWYPWDKLSSMFYDKQLGPVMEQSLVNLRKELERPVAVSSPR